ncbi:MAG: hypothetical protein R2847_11480 [Bacteroidia bacterium]
MQHSRSAITCYYGERTGLNVKLANGRFVTRYWKSLYDDEPELPHAILYEWAEKHKEMLKYAMLLEHITMR